MTFYVKKIWSLNPSLYKYISIKKAIKLYEDYLKSCAISIKRNKYKYKFTFKSFKDWLVTEI